MTFRDFLSEALDMPISGNQSCPRYTAWTLTLMSLLI